MNLATRQRQPFLDVPNATVTHVSHSWDHQRIAYSTSVRGAGFELLESTIAVAAADGSSPRTVVHESRTGATVEWPAWSPDGSRLVYTKTVFGSRIQRVEEVDLCTVRSDSSGLRRAAELRSEEPHIAWSPDGRYLASWGRLGLQIVDATGESATGYRVQWLTALPSGGPISWGP